IAILASVEASIVGLDDLLLGLRARVPHLDGAIAGRVYRGKRAGASEAYIVTISDSHYAVAYVENPAPKGTFDASISNSDDHWPEGRLQIAGHRAHIIVC